MMRLCKLALVVGACVLMVSPLLAQRQRQPGQPGGRGGFGGGRGGTAGLLRIEAVQKELNMDEGQVAKVQEALEQVNKDMADDLAKLRDRETPREERTKITEKLTEAQTKALSGVLKPEQEQRLKQIALQQRMRFDTVGVFGDPEIQKALKLSSDQKEKIDELVAEYNKERQALFGEGGRGGFNREALQKLQGLGKETSTNIQKTLNDDQKKTWEELQGKPFEMPAFGGGRGTPGKPGEGRRGRPGKPDKPNRIDF